jgi:hypothetical protein
MRPSPLPLCGQIGPSAPSPCRDTAGRSHFLRCKAAESRVATAVRSCTPGWVRNFRRFVVRYDGSIAIYEVFLSYRLRYRLTEGSRVGANSRL